MVLVAACTGEVDVKSVRADSQVAVETEPTLETLPPVGPEPSASEPPATESESSVTESSAPSTTVPVKGITILNDAPRPIEPVDPADDPLGERARRPLVPRAPEMQWQVTVSADELDSMSDAGDLVVYRTVAGEEHSINAIERESGEVAWTTTIVEHTTGSVALVEDVIVVEWLTPFFERFNTGIDAVTGAELWRTEPGGAVVTQGLLITAGLPGYLKASDPDNPQLAIALDRHTLAPLGSFHRTALGTVGPLRPDGDTLIEFDLATLDPIRSTILDRDISLFDSFAVTESFIVGASNGAIIVYDQTGALLNDVNVLDVYTPSLRAVGSNSDVVAFEVLSDTAALDLFVGRVRWTRESPDNGITNVSIFGLIDGQVHAFEAGFEKTADGDLEGLPSEVFVAETGESRCVVPDQVFPTRHGFVGDGTLYDLDCEPIWDFPRGPDTSMFFFDEGLVRVTETSTGFDVSYYD